jgi:hypothetical protein
MEMQIGLMRTAWMTVMAGSVLIGGFPAGAADGPPPGTPPDPQSLVSHAAGTWGACGSWWTETATQSSSGSVCGIDGLVADNGQPTQLVEPLISVSRYTCFKRKRFECSSESYSGTVRRSEMTVDPLLRRATIRGALGGCALDVEFAGIGPAQPQGNLWENYGMAAGTPTISVGGNQTFTSQASWWGGVCGQTVVPQPEEQGQASLFRGVEASVTGFGGGQGGDGCGCEGNACATTSRPVTSC